MGKNLEAWQHGFNKPGEISVVSQSNSLMWMSETVRYHLELYYDLAGREETSRFDAIQELFKALDLEPFSEVETQNLSGGNKRKLALAIALISKPRLLVMDEVSAGLDPISRLRVMQYVRSLSTEMTTLVIT